MTWCALGAALLVLVLRGLAPAPSGVDGVEAGPVSDARSAVTTATSSGSRQRANGPGVASARRAVAEQPARAQARGDDPSGAPGAPSGSRQIVVVDVEGRALVSDVLVFRDRIDAEPAYVLRTDESGQAVAVLEAGQSLVALTADGRCGVREVEAGLTAVRVCAYGPVSLRGRVVDLDTDEPLPGAHVSARWLDVPDAALARLGAPGSRERSVQVDSTGTFDLAPFRPGSYRLEFSCDGYDTYVDERPWLPTGAWDMGTVPLEALGDLGIRLLGFDPARPPSVSFGLEGERIPVAPDGRAKLRVPLRGAPQHFSIWLHNSTMMNVYHQGTLDEVGEVSVRVGGARTLRVEVEGEVSPEVEGLGRPSLRVRYSPQPGMHAEWNRDLDAGEPHETDCIDADVASVDLLALVDHWPNVLSSTTVQLLPAGVTEVVLQMPLAPHQLSVVGADGAPIPAGTFVELRRPHDPTRWLASGHADGSGRVFWPDVDAPDLFCSGVLTWGPPESFFIDLRIPNIRGAGPLAPLALGQPVLHRIQVKLDDLALAGARVRLLGRQTDQPWTFYDTDAEGWTPTFLLSSGSEMDVVVDDPRARSVRVPLVEAEAVIMVDAR